MVDLDPVSVLARLNRALLASNIDGSDGERFCTVLFGVLTPGPRPTVTLAAGGHPAPLVRRSNGGIEEVSVGGSLLGVFDDVSIGSALITLGPGETLVLFTDGAVEARREGVMFGIEGVRAAVQAAPLGAAAVAAAVERAVLAHTGGSISDDLAALVIHAID
jgi:sigma-B regulation protein RsbU (phosphoserine phosphatase)